MMGFSMNRDWAATARRVVQATAIVAAAAGVGVWGAILLAPQPSAPPPALASASIDATNTEAIAGWFGAGPASRVQVMPSGLIAAGKHGSAILAIDGGRPRAYGVGQTLAQGLILSQVLPTGVVVTQGGQAAEVNIQRLPVLQGFVPAAI